MWFVFLRYDTFIISLAQDKLRNMSVIANGWGSRDKARLASKRSHQAQNHDDNQVALATVAENVHNDLVNANPLAIPPAMLQIIGPKKSILRLKLSLK